VEQIVDSELGFVHSNASSARTAYLFVRDRRVLGIALAESISHAFSLNASSEKESKAREAMIGIHKIWVHETCRKQGIASHLVDTIRSKLIYGFMVPVNLVAFSSPSVLGLEFARQYTLKAMASTYPSVLVYDY
jgi:GNAT superfamily N-acetyltransferase